MVCPMRVIAVSVIALVAAAGVYLTFFWKPGVEEEKRIPKDEIDDAESDEEEEEEAEEMKGGGSSSTDRLMKVVKESSTMDLITGNVMLKHFSTGSLIAIGAAHVLGFVVFHHLYCVPTSS